jgi:cholest-4-en-3-one 26-monooxygenase
MAIEPPLDLTDPDTYVDGVPFETFRTLRAQDPVHLHQGVSSGPFWVVTRHADVTAVNKDAQTFSSNRGGTMLEDLPIEALEQQKLMMLNMDPPDHTKLRLLVNRGFLPRHVGMLEQHVRDLSREIIDDVIEQGSCDFVTDIAMQMPLSVIAEMMGVPKSDRKMIFDWTNRLVGSNDPEFNFSADDANNAALEMYMYANDLAARKRADPADDIVSALLHAEVDGERLSDLEFDLFFLLLAVAGNETTRNLLSHAMLALFDNPDQWDKLVQAGQTSLYAVEEFLRWGTPVMYFRRTAQVDTVLADTKISEGDKVTIWYVSANRDEAVFDAPDRFDVARTPNRHIAFGGGGPHFCLGANLARLEIRVMFDELIRRMPTLAPAGKPARLRSNFINGIKHLPVSFAPGPRSGG